MQVDVLNTNGQKASQTSLNEAIFGAPTNPTLVAQAIRVRLINARTGNASTKTRSDVRGGGRKPWRQKGTGRARQGSIRAPQWKGGGIVFGPHPRNLQAAMPQQMRHKALFVSLSDKLRNSQLLVLNKLGLEAAKTAQLQQIVAALPVGRTTLFVIPEKNDAVERSARNLKDVKVITARVLHPYEVLKYQTVVILEDSLPVLENTFLKRPASNVEQGGERQKAEGGNKSPEPSQKLEKSSAKTAAAKPARTRKAIGKAKE